MDNTTYIPQRVADINAEIARTGGYAPSGQPTNPKDLPGYTPTVNAAGSAITSASLTPTPSINLQGATDAQNSAAVDGATRAAGVSGATDAKITSAYNDLQNTINQQNNEANTAKEFAKNSLLEKIGLKSSALTDKTAALQTPEFLAKQSTSNKAYSDLQQSRQAKLNELAQLQASGLGQVQIQQKQQEITNRYALADANLSVSYDVANRDYQSALNNINTVAQLKMDAVQPEIEYYSALLSDANKNWSDSERNILQAKKDALAKTQDDAKEVSDVYATLLQNNPEALTANPQLGAGLSQQKDKVSALQFLAKNGVSIQNQQDVQLKSAQIAKANAEAKKTLMEAGVNGNPEGPTLPQDYAAFLESRTPDQTATFKSLPANDKSVVAQLVNGDALLTDLVKSRGAQGTKDIQRYIQEATAIDPTFSINTNKVRYNFLQDWNNPNGKASTVRNSINTALGHLADFKTNADALDPSSIKKLNSVKNILTTETGDPGVLKLRTDINALASEIATIYKGGQPTEKEISSWEETIAADFSKKQFQGVADEINKLLSSKISATNYQYKSTMGHDNPTPVIDPEKIQALSAVGIDPPFTTRMTGPDGQIYHVPNDKVGLFKQNGYK